MTTFEGPPLASLGGIGALTLGGFLEEVAARFGPDEALVLDDSLRDGATVRWTYADLLAEARGIGAGLLALGVAPGERVGLLMGNRPEAVAALFGIGLSGAVAVPMSTFAPRTELAHMLDVAAVGVVLAQEGMLGRSFLDDLVALQADRPTLRHLAVLGHPSWDDLRATRDAPPFAPVTPDDDALVIFSSGTTSEPKGMLHGHRAPTLQFWVQAQIFGRHEATRMFSALPLFWTAGLNTAMELAGAIQAQGFDGLFPHGAVTA